MNELMRSGPLLSPTPTPTPMPMPLTRANVTIRPGVLGDVPFLDSLQKLHTKQVGWMPTKQFEGKIAAGHVLIAEAADGLPLTANGLEQSRTSSLSPLSAVSRQPSAPLGYLIGNDQYFKHDDVGIIYQMNVLPGKQRGLIGAALLKAQFERSAYGCRLYCCWCAQDIAANRFWEAMGFVPLAFRAGSEKKARVHIFWQKRIRQGDTMTPWWFPSQTSGGSMRSDRIVLPIPPGTHWSDAKPMILPGMTMSDEGEPAGLPALPTADDVPTPTPTPRHRKPKTPQAEPVKAIPFDSLKTRGLRFGSVAVPTKAAVSKPTKPTVSRPPRRMTKNDPRLVAAARELRDRWLDQVNATPLIGCEKYAVSRAIDRGTTIDAVPTRLLAA